MARRFIGRVEQIARIRAVLRGPAAGPLLISGAPGIGRTSTLREALRYLDRDGNHLIRLEPSNAGDFATLRDWLPAGFPDCAAPGEGRLRGATRLMVEQAGRRRPVIVLDDAHLADRPSLLALRALSRDGRALLVVTRPSPVTGGRHVPDPTESLRYERGMRTVRLAPLTVDEVGALLADLLGGHVRHVTAEALHAATGGNPRSLHDLLGGGLAEHLVRRDGVWRLGEVPQRRRTAAGFEAAQLVERLVEMAGRAWRELALERAEELCRIAGWHGAGPQVASVWAGAVLFQGRARESLRLLDALPAGAIESCPRLALVKAMCLAFGLGRPRAAAEVLARVNAGGANAARLHAYSAWIFGMVGEVPKAAEMLLAIDTTEREAALFCHMTRGVTAFAMGEANNAVSHFRRALVTAESRRADLPWMVPCLRACLIDALLLAGRTAEATRTADGFHADEWSSGWHTAAVLAALLRRQAVPPPPARGRTAAEPARQAA